ncbi:hypothetical protein GGR57DRAFT_241365 [Xylariaceae sp. FL1272]|nr:hypothetical protein GGR57DRAFT_241365 [Xylariaceae sp. FL1272]
MYGQHRNVPSSNDQLSYVDAGHLIASFPPYHPGPHPQHLPQHHATGYIPQQVHYQQAMPSSHPVQQIPVTYAPVYNPQLAYPPYGADSGFSAGTVARQPWAALPYQVSQPLVENRPVPAPSGQSHLVEQEVHNAQIGGRIGGGALSTQASLYAPRGEHQVTSDTNIQSILPLRPMVREDQNPAPQAIQSDSMHERNRPHNASLLGRVFRDVNERIQDIDYLESQRRETKPSSHPKVDVVDSNNSPNPNEPEKNPIEDHDARSTPSRSRDQSQACDAKYRLDASLDPTYRPKDGESTGPGVTLFTIARKSAIDSDGEESMQQTFVRRDRLSVIADEPEQRSDATPESFITLVRHYDKNGQLQINTLELQSPLLINLLNNEVRSPEIRPLEELESCLLREPFTALYWRLESLRRYADASGKDEEAHDAVQSHKTSCANTILDILEKNFYLITRSFGSWNSASRRDTVSFRELWMLYKPGTIVFIRLEDQPPFALRVDDVEYTVSLFEVPGPKMGPTRARGAGRPSLTPASLDHMSETASPLSITAWGIGHHKPGAHYDRKFGLQMYSIVINPYGGTRKISELPILPEKFTEPELRDRVSASGRIFWELTSARLREVTESSEYYQQDGERIIVDPSCLEPDSSNPSGPSQHPTRPLTREEMVLGSKHRNENVRTPLFVTSFATLYRTSEPASRFWMQKYGVIDPVTTPTQEMIYVCPPHIWGFSLRSRVWREYCMQYHPVS